MGKLRRAGWRLSMVVLAALWGCEEQGEGVVPVDPGPEPELSCAQDDCLCQTQDDCLAHASCVFSEDDTASRCECVTGYDLVGQFCIFAGVADPDLDADPNAWRASGTATIDGDADEDGMLDPGQAVFDPDAVAALDGLSQTIAMPTLAEGEPFVARTNFETSASFGPAAPSPLVELNGFATQFVLDNATGYQSERICLGESAYGGDLAIRLSPSHDPNAVYSGWTAESLLIDSFQIEPALQGECPAPGEVMGGDFEDPTVWTQGLVTYGGTAEVADGVGLAGSRGGYLAASSCTANATLETKISIPETDVGQAVEVTWRAEGPANGVIGLGVAQMPHWAQSSLTAGLRSRPIGSLNAPRVNLGTSKMCIPPELIGASTTLSITLRRNRYYVGSECEQQRALVVDDIRLVDSQACAVAGATADPDFEAVQNALLPGWSLAGTPASSAEVISDTSASSGANLLHFESDTTDEYPTTCRPGYAETSIRMPAVGPGERPALRFDYRFGVENGESSYLIVAPDLFRSGYFGLYSFFGTPRLLAVDGGFDARGDTWQTETVCANANEAGRPLEWGFVYYPLGCGSIEGPQGADVDNIRVVAVPEEECFNP